MQKENFNKEEYYSRKSKESVLDGMSIIPKSFKDIRKNQR